MQKVVLITDPQSLASLNEELANDVFYVARIESGPSGWLVVLDDDCLDDELDDLEYEFDDEIETLEEE